MAGAPFLCTQVTPFLATHKLISHFSFDTSGAKEKFAKENADKGVSRSAEREEAYAASTAQTFEKV